VEPDCSSLQVLARFSAKCYSRCNPHQKWHREPCLWTRMLLSRVFDLFRSFLMSSWHWLKCPRMDNCQSVQHVHETRQPWRWCVHPFLYFSWKSQTKNQRVTQQASKTSFFNQIVRHEPSYATHISRASINMRMSVLAAGWQYFSQGQVCERSRRSHTCIWTYERVHYQTLKKKGLCRWAEMAVYMDKNLFSKKHLVIMAWKHIGFPGFLFVYKLLIGLLA
jgi:hypothetical protein